MGDEEINCPRCWAWYKPLAHHVCSEFHMMLLAHAKDVRGSNEVLPNDKAKPKART